MAVLRLGTFKIVMIRGTSTLESGLHCNNSGEETVRVKLTLMEYVVKSRI